MISKTVLIIGASKGIGLELVRFFANYNSLHVVCIARDFSNTDLTNYDNISTHELDISGVNFKDDLSKLIKDINVDFLINNAGALINKPFLDISYEDMLYSYQVNTFAVIAAIQAVIPSMISNGGHVVNISSMGGFQGTMKFPGLAVYSSSKATLVNLTEMLAEEFKDSKIKFNCLCLGAVQTDMLEKAFPGYKAPLNAEEMASFIGDFTLNSAKWMNGRIIPVSLSTP